MVVICNKNKIVMTIGMMFSSWHLVAGKPLSHTDCMRLVQRARDEAYIDQRFNCGDGTFPKKISEIVVHADVPASFTTHDAEQCGRGGFGHADGLQDELSFEVIHGKQGQLGSLIVTVRRAQYDQVKKEYDKSRGVFSVVGFTSSQNSLPRSCKRAIKSFRHATEPDEWFDLFQLDQQ